MKTRIKVYPYRQGSRSALALALALGGRVLRVQGSAYRPATGDTVINWGSGQCPYENLGPARVLNSPERVRIAANKRSAFHVLQQAGVSVPQFAVTPDAVNWSGPTVVRHKLSGHSGEGIEIIDPGNTLPEAPLYVEYIKKEDEYRVHVIGQEVVLVQRKARDKSVEKPNWQVRNHANGFVFVREGFTAPTVLLEQAKWPPLALGFDFGGVDVVFNTKEKRAYVLEINTAVGMEGQHGQRLP
jgi:glutathione synthase/RimK-type ligase-like ATP-grasp enzyme